MEPVVIIGGGGHAKVIIEILEDAGEFEVVGCTTAEASGPTVLNVPVLGDDSLLPSVYASGVRKSFVAVGPNQLRWRLSGVAAGIGFEIINAVSPRAVVSRRVGLGVGIAIMPGAVINSCGRVGNGAIVNTGVTVDHDCVIGNWVHLAPGTNLAGNVSVGEGAFLGGGVSVIPGISIGAWTTVGAGGVVIRDLPAGKTAVGVPARIIQGRAHH